MSAPNSPSGRTYRLAPPDRTGWMFGLALSQLFVLAAAVIGGALLMALSSPAAGVALMIALGGVGIARVGGEPLLSTGPYLLALVQSRRRGSNAWMAPIAVLGGSAGTAPAALAGLDLLVVDTAALGVPGTASTVAISRDRRAGTLAATVRVSGRQFGLIERAEQDWMVAQWGTALQGFVNERTPVVSVRWSEWASPAGLQAHRAWIADHLAAHPLDDVRAAYEALLNDAGGHTARHEVLVTITVHVGRVRRSKAGGSRTEAAVRALLAEVSHFSDRLTAARLNVSPPLTPSEWARAMRLRLDPASSATLDAQPHRLNLAQAPCAPANANPMACESTWTAWHTDNAWHRAMYVADWPRLDVPAAWMADLILYQGAVRTISVFFEPIPRSKSQRSIVRDAAKLESDAAARTDKGFRVGAHHRRARRAVEEREEELVAGYVEFAYAGVVTVTAASLEDLETATAEITQIAASVGIDLRPLHGRHDLAVAATLPIARGLAPKERP